MPTAGARAIDLDLEPILQGMTFEGSIARMNCGQLERKTYERVNKVLEALGGKWNRSKKGHIFEECPEEVIADAVAAGEYTDAKKAFQFYETPDWLVDKMTSWAGLGPEFQGRILEPSAGLGAIARGAKSQSPAAGIVAIEVNPKCRDTLSNHVDQVEISDFLDAHPIDFGEGFDFVLMNPPFTRSQDIAHVRHAFDFLDKGGILAAIMSPGFTFRSDVKATEFREWFESVGGELRHNDPGAFKSSGTTVNTVMVRIKT